MMCGAEPVPCGIAPKSMRWPPLGCLASGEGYPSCKCKKVHAAFLEIVLAFSGTELELYKNAAG